MAKMEEDARQTEERKAANHASLLGMRYFDTRSLGALPLFEDQLTNDERYRHHAVILSKDKGSMVIAITARTPQPSMRVLSDRFSDCQVSYVMISEEGFKDFMVLYDPPEVVHYQDVTINTEGDNATLQEVTQTFDKILGTDILDYLVRQANRLEASDIHFETAKDDRVRLRFRVHGVLHDIAQISVDKYRLFMAAVATAGDISSNSPLPQTGHINYQIEQASVNIRLETIPTQYGQDLVMRVFTLSADLLDLNKLGLSEQEEAIIREVIKHPSGLVLAAGPTGSGKTTTLYSIISQLNSPARKIITLEDPVEYSIEGLVQIPVRTMKKMSFADTLRSVLRLDPDIIMIGEIRDEDTAVTALQAALSGHLVLSTFHANDTAAAVARLLSYSRGNPLFTSALRLIIAQRLIRRLDDESKEAYAPEPHVIETIRQELGQDIDTQNIKLYRPKPSERYPFGYVGQTAVVEMLTMNADLEKLIHNEGKSLLSDDIRTAAISSGMKTLMQAALEKALAGVTSLEEVYRVL